MANMWKQKRININRNHGKDISKEDASAIMWNTIIKEEFTKYKNMDKNAQKEYKATAILKVKSVVNALGYTEADIKLTSKGFEIHSGHKKLVARGNGGALYHIEYDEE